MRLASLGREDRALVFETAALVTIVWVGLRVFRFQTLHRLLTRYAATGQSARPIVDEASTVARVRWALTAVCRRIPASTCLVQALAGDALLRRRGLAPELRVGIRPATAGGVVPLEAHAWVEWDGTVAIGGLDDLKSYERLAIGGDR